MLVLPAFFAAGVGVVSGASQTYGDAGSSNVWDTTTSNWGGVVWTNGNDAIFGGTGEAVAVATVEAHHVNFNTTGYSLTGGAIILAGAAPTLTVGSGVSTSISSVLAGSAGMTKAGTGLLTLSGVNTYAGGTNVSEGTLKLNLTARSNNSQLNLGTIDVGPSANLELFTDGAANTFTATALVAAGTTVSGTGTITKTGTGVVDFWGSPSIGTFAGLIDVQAGTLSNQTNGAGRWSTSAGNMGLNIAAGAYVDLRTDGGIVVNTLTGLGTVGSSFSAGMFIDVGKQGGNSTFGGVIQNTVPNFANSPTVALIKSGSGMLTLTGANTYSGTTTVGGGVLQIGNGGGTGALGSGAVTVDASGSLLFNRNNTYTAANAIGGAGGLTQAGAGGTVVLAGTSTYTGATIVSAGSLLLNAGTLSSSSAVSVATGATFGGKGAAGAVNVASGGVIQGGIANAGSVSLTSLTFAGSSPLNITPVTGSTASVAVSGAVTTSGPQTLNITSSAPLGSGSYRLLSYGSVGGAGTGAFVLGATPAFVPGSRPRSYVLDTSPATYIGLNVLGDLPVWSGGTSGVWDTSATGNWSLASDGTTPTTYYTIDAVQFNNTTGNRNLTISGTDVTPASATFNNSAGNNYTLGGSNGIAGAGSLTKTNTGKLTITNTNTYTGGTTVSGGILQLGDGVTNGVIAGDIINTANITFNNGSNQTYAGVISGTGGRVTKIGAGTLIFTGANSYTGGTSVTGGVLQIGNGVTNGTIGTGVYSVAGGAKLSLNYATAAAPPWANITGDGTLELMSAQLVNGAANWGTPAISSGFTGTLKLDKGRVNTPPAGLGGATAVAIASGAQFLAYDGTGAGTAYTYPQNFSINGMGWGENGLESGALRVSGMKATFTGSISLTGPAGVFNQANTAASAMTLAGPISDGGAGHNLTINAFVNAITLGNAGNSYSGNTVVNSGRTVIGASEVIPHGSGKGNVVLTGTLDLNTFNETINGLSGAGIVDSLAGGSPVLTVGSNNQTSTFSGVIRNTAGTVALTKVGSGTLTLTGNNTYLGDTTVNGGTLGVLTSPNILANYRVQNGATLAITATAAAPSVLVNRLVLEDGAALSLPTNGSTAVLSAVDVSTTGTVTIPLREVPAVETTPLIVSSAQSSALPVFTLGAVPRGVNASLDISPAKTDLVVTAINPVLWKGNNGTAWDTNVTTNWTLSGSPEKFQVGDNVQFGDSATGSGTVSVALAADVNPFAVEFANNSRDYILSGTGGITGATRVTKSGAAKLTIATLANSYLGGTIVNEGTLELGDGTNNGSVPGAVTTNALLKFNNGSAQTFAGAISGTGSVEKIGSGVLTLNAVSTFAGNLTVVEGKLVGAAGRSGGNSGFGASVTTRTIAVEPGAILEFQAGNTFGGHNFAAGPVLVVNGGSVVNAVASNNCLSEVVLNNGTLTSTAGQPDSLGGSRPTETYGAWNINGKVTSTGNSHITTTAPINGQVMLNSGGADSIFDVTDTLTIDASLQSGAASYLSGLSKEGSGTLVLSAANTYTGPTKVMAGDLRLTGSLIAGSAVTVSTGGTLSGSGAANGSVAIQAGGIVAPGISGIGTLTLGGTTLAGTFTCEQDGSLSDKLVVNGALNLTGASLIVSELTSPTTSSSVIATYTGALTGTFASVTPGYLVDYSKSGKIILAKIAGYTAWAAGFPDLLDSTASGDSDQDGITNLMEFVIGGDPYSSDLSSMPRQSTVGANLVINYKRNDASKPETTQTVEWSTNMTIWTAIQIPMATAGMVTVTEHGTAPDDVSVAIPLSNAVGGKIFARLRVTQP